MQNQDALQRRGSSQEKRGAHTASRSARLPVPVLLRLASDEDYREQGAEMKIAAMVLPVLLLAPADTGNVEIWWYGGIQVSARCIRTYVKVPGRDAVRCNTCRYEFSDRSWVRKETC